MNRRLFRTALPVLFILAVCRPQTESAFEGDFLSPPAGYRGAYEPDFTIVPGKSTERDLYAAYPQGPEMRITFQNPIAHSLRGRAFNFDRIITFGSSKGVTAIGSQGEYAVNEMLEFVFLCIYLKQGVVQDYTIKHGIRERGVAAFRAGKYDNIFASSPGELSPGLQAFVERYICGRGLDYIRETGSEYLLAGARGRSAGCPSQSKE